MIEIPLEDFTSILPLLTASKQPVVPRAVCEGYNPGRIFVDEPGDPAGAMIWLSCGYLYLVGNPPGGFTDDDLADLLCETFALAWQAAGESGFILVPFSPVWTAAIEDFLKGRLHEVIYRRTFAFHPERFASRRGWQEHIPPGFVLQGVDEQLAEGLGGMSTWASPQDYLAHGLGFCLLKDGEIISSCTSVFTTQTGVEIDVHTQEAQRGRGYAALTATALIDACLQQGRMPNWECFWDNEPSSALARKLGFEMKEDYPVYYWEMPA